VKGFVRTKTSALLLAPLLLAADAKSILGTWELVDASPVTLVDSNAHGMENHKLYYADDGNVWLIPAAGTIRDGSAAQYTFDGHKRTVTLPDGTVSTDPVAISGDTMIVTLISKRRLTYRRLHGANAYDRALAPESREVLARADDRPQVLVTYDDRDYSKQPLAQRIQGVWESVYYTKLRDEPPPYGFPNEKYVITARTLSLVPPNETKAKPDSTYGYKLKGDKLVVLDREPSTWTLSFDRWKRLVIDNGEYQVTLRLVTKSTDAIPEIPVKIALLE
jgi:hypothetical protein